MNYKQVLRYQPWLKLINRGDISKRLLRLTKGDIFIAYNTTKDTYEVHSVKSFRINESSIQVAIDSNMVNGFLVNDFKANNLRQHGLELEDQRDKATRLYERHEEDRFKTEDILKAIERTMGTKL